MGVAQLRQAARTSSRRGGAISPRCARAWPIADGSSILPEATAGSEPSWFGFPIAVRRKRPFTRDDLVRHLEEARSARGCSSAATCCASRPIGRCPSRVGDLPNTDFVMRQVFWIGVYPGLSDEMLGYMADIIAAFVMHR